MANINLTGKILNDLGFPAPSGLRVQALEYGVAADPKAISESIPLQADGSYTMNLGERKEANVHLLITDANGKEVGRTPMRRFLNEKNDLYWAVPSSNQQSEYQRLRDELRTNLGLEEGRLIETLLNLQEDGEKNRRDFTLLAQRIGWDARVIAMLARAEQLGSGDVAMRQYYYAGLRAGLPLEKAQEKILHRADIQGLIDIWKQAALDKIIDVGLSNDASLKDASAKFKAKMQNLELDYQGDGSSSTFGDLLSLTLTLPEDRAKFIALYANWTKSMDEFWLALAAQGFSADIIKKLQLDAQLGNLTLNNVPLIVQLKATIGFQDLVELALAGYHKADKWKPLLDGAGFPMRIPLPDAIVGDTMEERQNKYALLMADQLRKSYPTAVVCDLVNTKFFGITDDMDRNNVVDFLKAVATAHIGRAGVKPFEFGVKLLKNTEGGGFNVLSKSTQIEVKKLERTFQLSPDDHSMKVLLDNNLHSAMAIIKYGRMGFLKDLGGKFRPLNLPESNQIAEAIFKKALQIHTATLNMAIAMATVKNNPPVAALDGQQQPLSITPLPAGTPSNDVNEVLKKYPTLETLFGSLDYCECSECRSVLSPAAYMVDLLEFLNRTKDMDGNPLPANPLDVLLQRRPDIGNLELSCENTNTAMPYIDLSNEIMEYYVFNSTVAPPAVSASNLNLNGFKAADIPEGITSTELIAEPRAVSNPNIAAKVYDDMLKNAKIPIGLPFNQPLEALRSWCNAHDTTLAEALWTLKDTASTLTVAAPNYGWEDVIIEHLGLSRDEFKILTDPIVATDLPSYFNFVPIPTTVNTPLPLAVQLSDVKTFSRAVGLTYKELVAFLKLPFINPQGLPTTIVLINDDEIKFKFLNLTLAQAATIVQNTAATVVLPAGIPSTLYSPDPTAWLRANFAKISDLQNNAVGMDALFLRLNIADLTKNTLTDVDFKRLMRLIRLWLKVGISLEDFARMGSALMQDTEFGTITNDNIDRYFKILVYRFGVLKMLQQKLGLTQAKGYDDIIQIWDKNPVMRGSKPEHRQYDALARLMKMKVEDLQAYSRLSNNDAFLFWDLFPAAFVAGNTFNLPIFRFIDLVKSCKTAKIKLKELDYVLHNNDPDGKLTPSVNTLEAAILQIRAALSQISVDLGQVNDLDNLYAKVGQVFDRDLTDRFFQLLSNQQIFSTPLDIEGLPAELDKWSLLHHVSYDDFNKLLLVKGRLRAKDTQTIPADIPDNIKNALNQIVLDSKQSIDSFFTQSPDLVDYRTAFDRYNDDETVQRFNTLLTALMPDLRTRLQSQAIRQILAVAAKVDTDLMGVLLEDPDVLHASTSPNEPIVNDFLNLGSTENTDFMLHGGQAHLIAPSTEGYSFVLQTTNTEYNVGCKMTGNGLSVLLFDGVLDKNVPLRSLVAPKLEGAKIYNLNLVISNSSPENSTEPVSLKIKTRSMAVPILIDDYLIPHTAYDTAMSALKCVLKAVQTARLFRLNATEVRFFCHQSLFKIQQGTTRSFLSGLSTSGVVEVNTDAAMAASKALQLVDYVVLRDLFEGISEGLLITLYQNPNAIMPNGKSAFAEAMNVTRVDLGSIVTQIGSLSDDLSTLINPQTLRRVVNALNLLSNWNGALAAQLLSWIKPTPSVQDITQMKIALTTINERQIGREDWQAVLKKVNDPIRARQRDALVAWILMKHQATPSLSHINTIDKLFEYFLIDVGMEPMVQTSPIRQALSSVQLFIHRALMNLEPLVSPRAIPTGQWAWMKRYRVWEANRKIFLFPENWLETELRDNKSPFFKEFENELLQSDLTDELAEAAYLRYLQKLDDVAKLEICGMYIDERDRDAKIGNRDDVVHVFGRTNGNSRRFFYRRYEGGSWTAWEKVDAPIEGDQIMPVLWRQRLFLFWLNWRAVGAELAIGDNEATPVSGLSVAQARASQQSQAMKYQANLSWSELFKGKWQAPRSTEGTDLTFNSPNSDIDKLRNQITLDSIVYPAPSFNREMLEITVGGKHVLRFFNKNSNPELVGSEQSDLTLWKSNLSKLYGSNTRVKQQWAFGGDLAFSIAQPADASVPIRPAKLFTKPTWMQGNFTLLPSSSPIDNVWEAPFFYQDAMNVFSIFGDETTYDAVWRLRWFYEPVRPYKPPVYAQVIPIVTSDLFKLSLDVFTQTKGMELLAKRIAPVVNPAVYSNNLVKVVNAGNILQNIGITPQNLANNALPNTALNNANLGNQTMSNVLANNNVTNAISAILNANNPINNGLATDIAVRLSGNTAVNLGGGFNTGGFNFNRFR